MFHLNTTRVDKRETATVLLPLAFWRHATIHHCDSSQKGFFVKLRQRRLCKRVRITIWPIFGHRCSVGVGDNRDQLVHRFAKKFRQNSIGYTNQHGWFWSSEVLFIQTNPVFFAYISCFKGQIPSNNFLINRSYCRVKVNGNLETHQVTKGTPIFSIIGVSWGQE